jgi:hypothetical protein
MSGTCIINKIITLAFVLLSIHPVVQAQQTLVTPYLQPGNTSNLSKEQKVLIWQTDSLPGTYKIEYNQVNDPKKSEAKVTSTQLKLNNKTTYLYRANLSKLKFDAEYVYRVSLGDQPVSEGSFTTRTKSNQTKFAVFGDCGAGTPQQAKIAYQVYQQKPQFVLVTGDNVYRSGLEKEYRNNFFPYYTASEPDTLKGAPLMQSIPFYMLVGNHDVYGADFDKTPDGLAYYYYNDLPLNGPTLQHTVEVKGNAGLVSAFKSATEKRFPKMSNFSFDYGNVHIACIDANPHSNPLDPAMVQWLSEDLRNSRADWKIVAYHHPGFNSSKAHYDYQQMRLLSPILEELKVDLVLTGHVHNYQRTVPLKFSPKLDSAGTHYVVTPEGRVDGEFKLDEKYDGVTTTKPEGIIYIVTGAGGAPLYDLSLSGKPDLWKHEPQQNWVPFTTKIVSNKHSFTMVETIGKKLVLKQLDEKGVVFDEITITK